MHHKIWAHRGKLVHILRFSLDRIFPRIDTANPDSGDRGKRQTDPVEDDLVRSNPRDLPGFRKTIQREVTAPRLVSAKWQACYEAQLNRQPMAGHFRLRTPDLAPLFRAAKSLRIPAASTGQRIVGI